MTYGKIKSPLVTHNGKQGKWYHGKFYEHPEGTHNKFSSETKEEDKPKRDKKSKNQVDTGKRNEDLE